jgi:pimeloyl-ACP methyl ester carboxylesterase
MRQFTSAMQRDAPSLLRRFVALQSQGDARAASVAHKLRTALFTNLLPAQETLAAGLEVLHVTDLRAMLPSITQPTLVFHGERDAVTPCAAGEALAAALRHAQFEKIAGAGHAPFLSAPDVMAARIAAFMHESVATV